MIYLPAPERIEQTNKNGHYFRIPSKIPSVVCRYCAIGAAYTNRPVWEIYLIPLFFISEKLW